MNAPSTSLRLPATWLFVAVMAWFALWSPSRALTTPDEEIYLRTARAFRVGQFDIEPLPDGFGTRRGRDGKEYPQYGPALPLLAAPWVTVGDVLALTLIPGTAPDHTVQIDVFARWWASFFNGAVTALTAVLLFYWGARTGYGRRTALAVACMYATLTIAWPHGRTFFTEPLAGLALFAALWALLATDGRGAYGRRMGAWAGLFYGIAVLTRVDSLALLPPLLLVAAFPPPGEGDHDEPSIAGRSMQVTLDQVTSSRLVGFIIPLVIAATLIGVYNHVRFGSPFSTGYEDQPEGVAFTTPVLIGLHGFLFSSGRSLFIFSPLLILVPVGFVHLWKRDRLLVLALLSTAGFLVMAMSCWRNWAGGWDWGPRHIFQITPMLMLALCACPWRKWWLYPVSRIALVLLFLLSLAVQLPGVLQNAAEVIRLGRMDAFALQFGVYDLLKSPPVTHFQAMQAIEPNSIWVYLYLNGSSWCWAVVAPLLVWACATTSLVRWWKTQPEDLSESDPSCLTTPSSPIPQKTPGTG